MSLSATLPPSTVPDVSTSDPTTIEANSANTNTITQNTSGLRPRITTQITQLSPSTLLDLAASTAISTSTHRRAPGPEMMFDILVSGPIFPLCTSISNIAIAKVVRTILYAKYEFCTLKPGRHIILRKLMVISLRELRKTSPRELT